MIPEKPPEVSLKSTVLHIALSLCPLAEAKTRQGRRTPCF